MVVIIEEKESPSVVRMEVDDEIETTKTDVNCDISGSNNNQEHENVESDGGSDSEGGAEESSEIDGDSEGEHSVNDDEKNRTQHLTGNDIVKDVLARDAEALKAISVTKHLELEYDLGTLLAVDTNDLDLNSLTCSKDDYLRNLARDNTQLLINKIWQLPITRENAEILAKLPAPTYKLPREKRIPKPKPLSKWEKFAVEKGISKTKRPKAQWDETLQKWVPWWGYKRAQAEKEKNWVIEAKKNDDPYEDPYAKRKAQKRERVAKNEYQRLRNLAQAKNIKIPRGIESQEKNSKLNTSLPAFSGGVNRSKINKRGAKLPRMGLLTPDKMANVELKKAITIAKTSTGSLGKFQTNLPKEKAAKNVKLLLPMAKKKKNDVLKQDQEKSTYLNTIDSILRKKPKLDVEKAVNRHIHQEQLQRAEEKKTEKPKGKGQRRGKIGGKGKGKGKGKAKGRGQGKVRMGQKGGGKSGKGGKKH